MDIKRPIVTICIPSYNRPAELLRLLQSIDARSHEDDIEIVICEDKSPKREEIRNAVTGFINSSSYDIRYIENTENYGYDKNLRTLISYANGEYIIFMGDDDLFIPHALDPYIDFICSHKECGYILRSYENVYQNGKKQVFRYFKNEKIFEPGDDSYITMFSRSVFISGFTIKAQYAKDFESSEFDGSLLYQLYLLAEVCRLYPSCNCNILLTQAIEGGIPYFGNSASEKGLYTPGTVTVDNSLNFMKWYVKIIQYMGEKYHSDSAEKMLLEMSKYSYSFLSIQRPKGKRIFKSYAKGLKEIGLGRSKYFDLYYYALLVFGKQFCDKLIRIIKNTIGHRPKL